MQFTISFDGFTDEQEHMIQHDFLLYLKDEAKGHIHAIIDNALGIRFHVDESKIPVHVTFQKIPFEEEKSVIYVQSRREASEWIVYESDDDIEGRGESQEAALQDFEQKYFKEYAENIQAKTATEETLA